MVESVKLTFENPFPDVRWQVSPIGGQRYLVDVVLHVRLAVRDECTQQGLHVLHTQQ